MFLGVLCFVNSMAKTQSIPLISLSRSPSYLTCKLLAEPEPRISILKKLKITWLLPEWHDINTNTLHPHFSKI